MLIFCVASREKDFASLWRPLNQKTKARPRLGQRKWEDRLSVIMSGLKPWPNRIFACRTIVE